ncbi:MAG: hypothetical protein EOO86_02870 [Pedobacter sp.]|nr:MAG: hypothetical protein EOO86_02870 [Pedobacter sp.]
MENDKSKKEIIQELKQVHERVENDPDKKYDAGEVDSTIDDLGDQIIGSDADSDKSLEINETEKEKQSKGSDASKI